jgi:DNA-binding NarL/FixJ family response regulator
MMIKVEVIDKKNLTKREAQLLAMIAEGSMDATIAHKLYISRRTVETHLSNLYDKLNVRSEDKNARVLAVSKAYSSKIIEISASN